MYSNYLKIAWRNLKKQPFITSLNIFGLAVGMAGGLLISLFIYDELSFDSMFPDAGRIYRLNSDLKFGGQTQNFSVVPAPMAAALTNDFPQVAEATRFRMNGSVLIKKSGTERNIKELHTVFVDPSFFKMFGFGLMEGDPATALTEPNTLILTKSTRERLFGQEDALGQSVVLNNRESFTVVGVMEDMPRNSFLREQSVFMAMAGYKDAQLPNWGSNNYHTFIKLMPGVRIEDLQAPLQSMIATYVIPWVQPLYPGITLQKFEASGNYIHYGTIPLKDIHLHSQRVPEMSRNNTIQNVYILSFVALFLISLASVNFMNLSIAQSLKRAKEVGIRKTLGSGKWGVIRQFLTESGVISFISLLLALLFAIVCLPYFNELSGKAISIPYDHLAFWLILLLATLVLGLLSGSYPSFFISRFLPVKVLKGNGSIEVGGGKIRNSLVIFQFSISVILIIGTLVIYRQLNYIQNKDLGYTKDQVVIIDDVYGAGGERRTFKDQVLQLGHVQNASLSDYFPTPSSRNDNSFNKEGAMEQEHAVQMQQWYVDYDYIATLGLEIIAGRDFDRQFKTDSTAIIINEAALAVLGVTPREALGMRITSALQDDDRSFSTVIGVVKDFHYESLREHIEALSLSLTENGGALAVKLDAGDFSGTITQIGTIWNSIAPGQPFNYYFMDSSFNDTYEAEQRLGRIFVIFTTLSIIIACLGLFGLAAFNAEKRTKEIGIRKVLGASMGQITYRLSIDFLKLVGIAILISLPLGWLVMDQWLRDFTYRVAISWWIPGLAAALAIGISMVTLGYQSIKASMANPVNSLRTE